MSKCDIKDSSEAWNTGVKAFKKAFLRTGGKTSKALQFAMNEVMDKHPDFDFEVKLFTEPIISTLKKDGVIDQDYQYKGKKDKQDPVEKKIEKAINKFKSLPVDKRKDMAKKAYETFAKDGVLNEQKVKNLYAEAAGLPYMDDKFEAQIEKTAKDMRAVDAIDSRVKEIYKAIQEGKTNKAHTKEKDKMYFDQLKQLAKDREKAIDDHLKSSTDFAQNLQTKGFWAYNLGDFIRMNLMNPVSLLKNVTGAGFDAVVRNMSSMIASPISQFILNPIRKINSNPIGAKIRGGINSRALKQAGRTFKYGANEYSQEVRRVNHMNAVRQFTRAMDASGTSKIKGLIAATLKLHPDVIARSLGAPDAAVFETVLSSEMNRIAESKGLKGAEKQAFLMSPDEKSIEIATEAANKATFKDKLPFGLDKFTNFDPYAFEKNMIEKNYSPLLSKVVSSAIHLSTVIVFPFVKTPLNIVRSSSKILLPELVLTQAIIEGSRETDPVQKQKIILEGTTTAAVGFFIRQIALQMVAQGLISAGYSDEEKKTKDNVEQKTGGPNRINYSAFIRGLTFGDISEKASDKYVDLNSLGIVGIVMGAYAHAYNQYSKEDIKKNTQYTKDWSNAISVPANAFKSEFAATLDYTFFSGFNQLERMVKNEQGYEADQWSANALATIFGGIAPSTYQKLSTQKSEEVKKQFNKELSFSENLANTFKYRFFFNDDNLKNKYFSLAEDGKGAVKKKEHMLFDNYFGRVLQSEFGVFKSTEANVDTPVSRLYEASRETEKEERDKMFPNSIDDKVSIKTRKGGKQKSSQVQLTDEQHAYLQEQASNYRMMLATPFIMSEDFQKDDFETKSKVLQTFYQQGLEMAKKDLKSAYPEIGTQVTTESVSDKKEVKKQVKKYKTKLK